MQYIIVSSCWVTCMYASTIITCLWRQLWLVIVIFIDITKSVHNNNGWSISQKKLHNDYTIYNLLSGSLVDYPEEFAFSHDVVISVSLSICDKYIYIMLFVLHNKCELCIVFFCITKNLYFLLLIVRYDSALYTIYDDCLWLICQWCNQWNNLWILFQSITSICINLL